MLRLAMRSRLFILLSLFLLSVPAGDAWARLTLGVAPGKVAGLDSLEQARRLAGVLAEVLEDEVVIRQLDEPLQIGQWLNQFAMLDLALLEAPFLAAHPGEFLIIGPADSAGQLVLVARQGASGDLPQRAAAALRSSGRKPGYRLPSEAPSPPAVVAPLPEPSAVPPSAVAALTLGLVVRADGPIRTLAEADRLAAILSERIGLPVRPRLFDSEPALAEWFRRFGVIDLAIIAAAGRSDPLVGDYRPLLELTRAAPDASPALLVARRDLSLDRLQRIETVVADSGGRLNLDQPPPEAAVPPQLMAPTATETLVAAVAEPSRTAPEEPVAPLPVVEPERAPAPVETLPALVEEPRLEAPPVAVAVVEGPLEPPAVASPVEPAPEESPVAPVAVAPVEPVLPVPEVTAVPELPFIPVPPHEVPAPEEIAAEPVMPAVTEPPATAVVTEEPRLEAPPVAVVVVESPLEPPAVASPVEPAPEESPVTPVTVAPVEPVLPVPEITAVPERPFIPVPPSEVPAPVEMAAEPAVPAEPPVLAVPEPPAPGAQQESLASGQLERLFPPSVGPVGTSEEPVESPLEQLVVAPPAEPALVEALAAPVAVAPVEPVAPAPDVTAAPAVTAAPELPFIPVPPRVVPAPVEMAAEPAVPAVPAPPAPAVVAEEPRLEAPPVAVAVVESPLEPPAVAPPAEPAPVEALVAPVAIASVEPVPPAPDVTAAPAVTVVPELPFIPVPPRVVEEPRVPVPAGANQQESPVPLSTEPAVTTTLIEPLQPLAVNPPPRPVPVVMQEPVGTDDELLSLQVSTGVPEVIAQPDLPQELRPPGVPLPRPGRLPKTPVPAEEPLLLAKLETPMKKTVAPPPLLPPPDPEPGVVYLAPFITLMVPPEVQERVFDQFVDTLNQRGAEQKIKFVILKQGVDKVDRNWLQARKHAIGEIYGYVEESGCCTTDLRTRVRLTYYRAHQTDPVLKYEYPIRVFFDHDRSTLAAERQKLADQVAAALVDELLKAVRP